MSILFFDLNGEKGLAWSLRSGFLPELDGEIMKILKKPKTSTLKEVCFLKLGRLVNLSGVYLYEPSSEKLQKTFQMRMGDTFKDLPGARIPQLRAAP